MTDPAAPEAPPSEAAPEAPPNERTAPLLPPGNPRRPRSLVLTALASTATFLLMSTDRHFAFSVPLGAVLCLIAALGMLDFLGTFDDRLEPNDGAAPPKLLCPRVIELAGSIVLAVAVLRLVVTGRLPFGLAGAAVAVPASILWLGVAGFRALAGFGFVNAQKPWHARYGFWLFALNVLLYVPLLGSYSLSDPWETHYGEVAREMLARDDWISTWWAQENWFWSKPVLDFWLQALSFSTLGVGFQPGEMLASVHVGLVPRPEWAARMPVFALMLPAVYLAYRAVAQRFGARAGFLGALVLSTAPHWYVIGRQSMTDMPYVAPLTGALACVLLALGTPPDALAPVRPVRLGRRVFGLSAYHLVFGLVLVSALPQILYLASRHLSIQTLGGQGAFHGFRWHLDEMLYGSAGNCGLPGNDDCRATGPVDAALQPGFSALVWTAVLALLLFMNRGERRTQRLLFLGAWYLTALSALAKGAPGLVLPLVIALGAVVVSRRFGDLARLELVSLGLIVLAVCLPWYVQMYARHGSPFTDRLLFHDMYKRAFVHVHDTNTGDDVSFRYYVWQLGYGLFPWTGLGVAGLIASQREGDEAASSRGEGLGFLLVWFVLAFSMFTISLTKFHHYILPAVPPIALLTGIFLDRALPTEAPRGRALALYLAFMAGAALLLAGGVLVLGSASVVGSVPAPAPSPNAAVVCFLGAAALFVIAMRSWPAKAGTPSEGGYAHAVTSVLGLGAAIVLALVGRDLASVDDPEGPARLTYLASYNYARAWPANLDFRGVLGAVTVAGALAAAALATRRLRHHAVVLFACVSVWAAVWALDVYLVRAAPHWGQRETILTYYARRNGPEEPLAAYQMNWKGENFYTSNHVPAFVSTGAKFKTWLTEEKERGARVLFFITEHTRESTLKTELGKVTRYEKLTTKEQNNKFFLARVEL